MEKELLNGQMGSDMKVIIKMIKNMVLAFFNGKMVENMKDVGLMENNMDRERSLYQVEKKKKESGKMERELDGLMQMNHQTDDYIRFNNNLLYFVVN